MAIVLKCLKMNLKYGNIWRRAPFGSIPGKLPGKSP